MLEPRPSTLVPKFKSNVILEFAHIPKCAGSSIIHTLWERNPLLGKNFISWATRIRQKRKSWYPNKFLFAFVRNPYDRLVSAYFHIRGVHPREWLDINIKNDGESCKGIHEFVDHNLSSNIWSDFHLHPQHYFIPEGADFIGKYENLHEDFEKLKKIVGIKDDVKLLSLNRRRYPKISFTEKQKNIIYEVYQKDFELFGYEK